MRTISSLLLFFLAISPAAAQTFGTSFAKFDKPKTKLAKIETSTNSRSVTIVRTKYTETSYSPSLQRAITATAKVKAYDLSLIHI